MTLETQFNNKINNIKNNNPLYIRNLLKEVLQDFTLNYIYNSDYNNLIFTGGTCLRKVYGLNRLSEDLDFDYIDNLNISEFANDISVYFRTNFNINPQTKISVNNKTVFIKFSLSDYENIIKDNITSKVLFLRCDFSEENKGGYSIETNSINTQNFSFFVRNYDLPTLFANKIIAFLERTFYKGEAQELPFKGRDVYDLFWLINLSASNGFRIKPNKERLNYRTQLDNISSEIKDKINKIDPKFIYEDLYPLIESESYLNQFKDNYSSYIINKIDLVLSE